MKEPSPRFPEREEYPPRSQWSEQEKETCGPQTIMEMRWVACTPEQYKLVFQNIAHANGFKEVLSAQYDSLLYLFADWVTDLQLRRMDQYNVRIMERNRERTAMKETASQLQSSLSASQAREQKLREALEEMETEEKALSHQATECMEFIAWLAKYEFSDRLIDERLTALLKTLALSAKDASQEGK